MISFSETEVVQICEETKIVESSMGVSCVDVVIALNWPQAGSNTAVICCVACGHQDHRTSRKNLGNSEHGKGSIPPLSLRSETKVASTSLTQMPDSICVEKYAPE